METLKLIVSAGAPFLSFAQAALLFVLGSRAMRQGAPGRTHGPRYFFCGALALSLASLTALEAYAVATDAIVSVPELGYLMWDTRSEYDDGSETIEETAELVTSRGGEAWRSAG